MSKWHDISTAPKDQEILLNVGLPWPVIGIWSEHYQHWVHTAINCDMVKDRIDGVPWQDIWYESETDDTDDIIGWMPLPEV